MVYHKQPTSLMKQIKNAVKMALLPPCPKGQRKKCIMSNKNFLKTIENNTDFITHIHNDWFELETWTQGGVNMFVHLDKTRNEPFFEQFKDYVNNFDMNDEIDIHRQDPRYQNDSRIFESVMDFTEY